MTDSGFSSAASNRSASSIVKPSLLNPFMGNNSAPSKAFDKENACTSSGVTSLPKPCAYFQSSGGRPVIPNRFLYGKNHGGYSPGIYSPKEMSPMSSLAFDFRELNTSQDTSDTPRKRLSLSSLSSLDSPHPLGHPSPAALSFASSFANDDEGCFTDTPSPLDLSEMEAKFDRALQERDDNVCHLPASGDGKLNKYRRFKSMPLGSKCVSRLHAIGNDCSGKENSPVFSSKKQIFSKRSGSIDSPSPLQSMTSPFHALNRRRHSTLVMSPTMTSSPLVTNFASSSSSAFNAVQHNSTSARRPLSDKSLANQEQLCKDAEKRLRDAKSPTLGSLTPEKSVVPGSIASLSARTRPASAVPFFRAKSSPCCTDGLSPIPVRANKRSLDSTNSSLVAASKRHKKSGTSFTESTSTRRKMAFASKDRKVKSADAAFMHSSPIACLKSNFRPISAPAQMLCFDDDAPLTQSRLCSTNDSDSEDDVMMMSSSEHDRSDADERLLEEMLSENTRARKEGISGDDVNDSVMNTSEAPSGLDGLISAPLLLLSTSVSEKENDSLCVPSRLPKPRELFRSPSAPPVVPSRRSLLAIKRSEQQSDCCTPFGIKRKHISNSDDIPTLPEVTSSHDIDEEPSTFLNRSRSFNELDIMKAVDLGCSDENLIGDFSRVCSLKTVTGKHQDLKYITPQTLIDLVDKKRDVGDFEVIDCRYPYEYEGGHVAGANCIWEEENLFKRYFNNPKPMWASKSHGTYKPPVLVFYCEFSSERGPRMARALRSQDRELNRYPHLHYPEIYLLKDGYKNFFHTEGTKEYCEPQTYRPMTHSDFARELRTCRTKSKTWAGEKTKCGLYNRLKRL